MTAPKEDVKPAEQPLAIRESRLQVLLNTEPVSKRFQQIMGKRAAAFMSSIISAVAANDALKTCDPMSVISAAAVAAALDLPITPGLGFAHIVPYSGAAQFQIGWKGFVQLAMRTGQYKTMNHTAIYEGQLKKLDPFTGDMEFVEPRASEQVIGYLFFFRLVNGFEKYFYMTKAECEAHGKRYSRSYKAGKGLWVDDFDAMALKTVVKLGLSKYGVLSVEMQRAFEMDQAAIDENGQPQYIDAEAPATQPTTDATPKVSRVHQVIDAQAKAAPPEAPI